MVKVLVIASPCLRRVQFQEDLFQGRGPLIFQKSLQGPVLDQFTAVDDQDPPGDLFDLREDMRA